MHEQLTMFGGAAPAGARAVQLAEIDPRLADLTDAQVMNASQIEPDARKVWLRAHAGQQVTVTRRDGMRLYVTAEDGSTGIVLTTEAREL